MQYWYGGRFLKSIPALSDRLKRVTAHGRVQQKQSRTVIRPLAQVRACDTNPPDDRAALAHEVVSANNERDA